MSTSLPFAFPCCHLSFYPHLHFFPQPLYFPATSPSFSKSSRFTTLVALFLFLSACSFPALLKTLIIPYWVRNLQSSSFDSCMKATSNMGTDEYSALTGFFEQQYVRERLVSLVVVVMSWRKAAISPSLEVPQHLGKLSCLRPPCSLMEASPLPDVFLSSKVKKLGKEII